MKTNTKDRIFALIVLAVLLVSSILMHITEEKWGESKLSPYSLSRFRGY